MLIVLLVGCAEAGEPATDVTATPLPFAVPAGYELTPLPYQFNRPTQFLVESDQLWVAQLNGGENEAVGQVVRVDLATGAETVIIGDLDKPTGIALLDGWLWIATRDALLRMEPAEAESLEVVVRDIPNNGRSNGTLTVTPDGRLLYESSGRRSDPESGRLWAYDPATGASSLVAEGLKNAYAHFYDAAGRLWITEIGDGSVEDVPFPDEINLVVPGADFGWPGCYGRELAGPECEGTRAAVAVLPVSSTPTGIAGSPFAPDTLLVTQWLTGELVTVTYTLQGNQAVGEVAPFISGLRNPQHVLNRPDGAVWISEYSTGLIWELRRDE